MSETVRRIESRLRGRLVVRRLEIRDDSARHAGHAGASSGGGHYKLVLVADEFEGRTRLEQHRLVYEALDDLIPGEIHALALQTLAPSES